MQYQHIFHSFLHILNEMSPYVLLGFLIAGLLHVFVNEDTLTRHLSGNGWKSVVKAAAIGIPLPLCSCGVLPTAVSLRRQGASKAATTSFLIATPQTGVDSIAATYSLLGLPFALIRPIAALTGAIFGGVAVGKLAPDKDGNKKPSASSIEESKKESIFKKLKESIRYGFFDMIDSMGKWLVIGLVIATLITIFVPDSFFVGLRQYPLVAMIAVVLIAVPMYICATGSIPIAMSLMLKGLSPGVAFVMLMAGPAANFASILILDKTQGRKATAIYVCSVIITAIAFGLVIDFLLPSSWFTINAATDSHSAHMHMGWFETVCSIVLGLLLLFSFVKKFISKLKFKNISQTDMTKTYKIEGMNCSHCRASVEKAIASLQGVDSVEVDLSSGLATVSGEIEDHKITEAVRLAGFDISIG
ncbi:MAG: SO_0444 family Cu/Zn efflux transporter [Muribaculaceae bacterium]|nr:SO_0444 family Cu/Zn efflux transporter [Muribaculaceae bacterium]